MKQIVRSKIWDHLNITLGRKLLSQAPVSNWRTTFFKLKPRSWSSLKIKHLMQSWTKQYERWRQSCKIGCLANWVKSSQSGGGKVPFFFFFTQKRLFISWTNVFICLKLIYSTFTISRNLRTKIQNLNMTLKHDVPGQ